MVGRYTFCSPSLHCPQSPTFGMVVQGRQSIELGGHVEHYGVGDYLFVSFDVPVAFRVMEASEEQPCLGLGMAMGGNTLEKSLQVLKPGGKLIGIAGPPDPDFAKQMGASWFLKTAMRFLSYRIRKAAGRRDVGYSFLFMRADGGQLAQIAKLVDVAAIRPVIDRIFPFESTQEALAYVETGRAKGKVVIKIR
nr:zinc-binding dehydrogenase [Paraburkholderia lacunae]